ncbi:MAG TPA: response regulator transcription factor [Spirochaetia bacterium]|nr:response regulator transcription factor [Spirochaetia bacterium]
MKVLIVEDAAEVVESIKLCISIRWPDCVMLTTAQGREALTLVERESPDLVILDLALLDGNGMDVLKDIRRFSDVPVLIVSATADEVSRVKGLELGADDYIVKPFSHTELLARMRATLRRAHMPELWKDEGIVTGDKISIDLAAGRVYVDGSEAQFSATEWKLLAYLVRNAGKVISTRALTQNVWGLNFVENSTIKMCVRRVRLKLGDNTQSPRIIRSYRGRGYAFELKK